MIALSFESGLAQLQRSFAEAVFSADAPIPATIRAASGAAGASRFGVYRNNVVSSLLNAIRARYPVVRKLLWDDAFDRAAFQYVTTQPPRSPVLLEYGDSFPQFLHTIGQGAAVDYLADIAALEAAHARAYHAADTRPVGADAFASLSPDRLANMRLELHPSVVLLKSRFPVVSVWEANLSDNDNTITVWKPESALIVRPDLQVDVHRLPPGGYEFIAALMEHQTVGEAMAHGAEKVPDFDLAACLTTLIAADIVVGFEPAEDPRD
jgi:hypothetical protein